VSPSVEWTSTLRRAYVDVVLESLLPIKQGMPCSSVQSALRVSDIHLEISNRNTLILTIILAGLHPSRSQLGLAAVSLGSFLLFGFIFARLGLRFTNNSHRQKWWLLVSAITQAFFVLIPCVLLTILRAGKEPLELEDKWDALMIGLFAAGSGVQVVMVCSPLLYRVTSL
jgi:hypothetical protein